MLIGKSKKGDGPDVVHSDGTREKFVPAAEAIAKVAAIRRGVTVGKLPPIPKRLPDVVSKAKFRRIGELIKRNAYSVRFAEGYYSGFHSGISPKKPNPR